MNRFCDRPFLRLALIGVAVASLGLAACGRKGPLDPPPAASVAGEPQANAQPAPGIAAPMVSPIGGQSKSDNPGVGPDGKAQAPAGPNKRIFLDGLLN
jgi:predicted small lipoprotein YifL